MTKLNLKAVCFEEEKVLNYLCENASESLVKKINSKPERPMVAMLAYCHTEAEKIFKERGSHNNCVMIDDPTVYGWCVHYFEDVESEEDIKKAKEALKVAEQKAKIQTTTKPVEKKKKPSSTELLEAYHQLSLLDLLDEVE